jgi:HEPN domain-containing protein
MSADVLIASYLRIAKEDRAGARQLASTGNCNAMDLCSQAAEEIIRAVLTLGELDRPDVPARNAGPLR